jgi:hypothetical protein
MHKHLIKLRKVLPLALHINLGLMKDCVKVLNVSDENGERFRQDFCDGAQVQREMERCHVR